MKLHPLLRFLLSTSLIIIIIHCNQVEPSSPQYHDPRYDACTTSCGNTSLKISYPFWGVGRPQYRGHPGFNLSCDGKNFKINILSQTYNVIDINYNASTLKIVNQEFMNGECPGSGDYHNTTLNLALFNFTSSVRNATLFYDCPDSKSIRNAPINFACPGKYKNSLSFFVLTEAWEHELESICGVQVYVPVLKSASIDLSGNPRIADVLKGGFEVKWVIDQGHCQECYMSGGCCEYNMSIGNSTCYCKSGSYPTVCPLSETPRINLEAKIGIGTGAVGAFLLVMITLFVCARGKKDYHTSSTFPSQNTAQLSSASVQEKSSYFGAHLFSYNELKQATNNFDPSEELGKGGFGTVYHGKLQDGREVAIKRLYEKHNKQVAQFMNELEILTCLDHKNLVKLYGCTPRRSPKLLLVFEYVPNGTLADHLHGKQAKTKPLPWPIRLRIAVETAIALVYLHASDIIHRDIKTKNILLDTNYSVKVADFGLSRLFPLDVSHISTTPQGSPGYLDPEYHQCYQLTNKSDVYSFGVVLAELISGKSPVDISRSRQEVNLSKLVVNKIIQRAWNEIIDPDLEFENSSEVREEVISVAELTFKCLQATSSARPSMEEVLDCLRSIQGETSQQKSGNPSKEGSDIIKESDSVTTSSNDSKSCDKTIQKAEPKPNGSRLSSQGSTHANINSEVVTSLSLEDII